MSPVHIYQTIYQDLLEKINSGLLRPGDKLPSEGELAAQYGVSRMTVRQALDLLEGDYVVMKRRGIGRFVKHATYFRHLNRLAPFKTELQRPGAQISTKVLVQEVTKPPTEVALGLELRENQDAIHLVRLRHVDENPAAVQSTWLPYGVAPQLARMDLENSSLYDTLAEAFGIRLRWAEQQITADAASAQLAEWLQVDPGSPLIATTRVAFPESGSPVEFTHAWTRPEHPLLVRLDA
jgi:GntR family transcriptional regulator